MKVASCKHPACNKFPSLLTKAVYLNMCFAGVTLKDTSGQSKWLTLCSSERECVSKHFQHLIQFRYWPIV